MLTSTVINHRRHVGLQKLSALAAITHSSLGPNKKFKFIRDEASGESALACSCVRVLENLELTCGVGRLVQETVRAHQEVYRTGAGSLLFLAGAWSRAALECLRRGVSVTRVVSAMSEGMEACSDVCGECGVSTEGLGAASPGLRPPEKPAVPRGAGGGETLNAAGRRKVKLSRHSYDAVDVAPPPRPERPDVAHLAAGLSHGCVDAMNLVVEAVRMQAEVGPRGAGGRAAFDVANVATCALPGLPEDRACVLPGCVVLVSDDRAAVARHLKGRRLKVALITGDLSPAYRHLGFQRPRGERRVRDGSRLASGASDEEAWLEETERRLLDLEVDLVVVGGLADERAVRRCCRRRILVVDGAKAAVSKALASATGAVPVAYAAQLTRRCVGVGAEAAVWREGRASTAVNISAGALVTAVLTSHVDAKLQALEDRFWACAYRLHHALDGGVVLPGAGVTEMLCVRRLEKEAELRDESAADPYRGLVLRLMADGFVDYVATVMVNTGTFSKAGARTALSRRLQACAGSPGAAAHFSRLFSEDGEARDAPAARVYDGLTVKREAWRRALDLVLLVLQTDAEVITGVDPEAVGGAEGNLMLL